MLCVNADHSTGPCGDPSLEEESTEEREFKEAVQARRRSPLDTSSSYHSKSHSDSSDDSHAAQSPPRRQTAAQHRSSPPPRLQTRQGKLYVVGNGQGSPCLDLRRVPDTLADATVGADLVVLEGMGRSIITNYCTKFK